MEIRLHFFNTNTMHITSTTTLTPTQKEAIHLLWNAVYPQILNHPSLEHLENYLSGLENPTHLLIVDKSGNVHGWLSHFIREKETWFAMLIASKLQGQGWGSKLLKQAQANEPVLNGWVVREDTYKKQDGTIYSSPFGFYRKHGFQLLPDHRAEFGELSVVKMKWAR